MGEASLQDLREEERLKIGNVLRELAKAQREGNQAARERQEYLVRLNSLRGQNDSIIKETIQLRGKFRQSLELLKTYQQQLATPARPEASVNDDQGDAHPPASSGTSRSTLADSARHPARESARMEAVQRLRQRFPRAAAAYDHRLAIRPPSEEEEEEAACEAETGAPACEHAAAAAAPHADARAGSRAVSFSSPLVAASPQTRFHPAEGAGLSCSGGSPSESSSSESSPTPLIAFSPEESDAAPTQEPPAHFRCAPPPPYRASPTSARAQSYPAASLPPSCNQSAPPLPSTTPSRSAPLAERDSHDLTFAARAQLHSQRAEWVSRTWERTRDSFGAPPRVDALAVSASAPSFPPSWLPPRPPSLPSAPLSTRQCTDAAAPHTPERQEPRGGAPLPQRRGATPSRQAAPVSTRAPTCATGASLAAPRRTPSAGARAAPAGPSGIPAAGAVGGPAVAPPAAAARAAPRPVVFDEFDGIGEIGEIGELLALAEGRLGRGRKAREGLVDMRQVELCARDGDVLPSKAKPTKAKAARRQEARWAQSQASRELRQDEAQMLLDVLQEMGENADEVEVPTQRRQAVGFDGFGAANKCGKRRPAALSVRTNEW
ncbi:hypothetical protein AB1Y20_007326 [Prymnesium parvum]|uniref:Proteophosphoglycan ppg4 n=1 Tax=Prymnesium parvum TaxID=97485 RepID=A0AB34IX88_PRYPA